MLSLHGEWLMVDAMKNKFLQVMRKFYLTDSYLISIVDERSWVNGTVLILFSPLGRGFEVMSLRNPSNVLALPRKTSFMVLAQWNVAGRGRRRCPRVQYLQYSRLPSKNVSISFPTECGLPIMACSIVQPPPSLYY